MQLGTTSKCSTTVPSPGSPRWRQCSSSTHYDQYADSPTMPAHHSGIVSSCTPQSKLLHLSRPLHTAQNGAADCNAITSCALQLLFHRTWNDGRPADHTQLQAVLLGLANSPVSAPTSAGLRRECATCLRVLRCAARVATCAKQHGPAVIATLIRLASSHTRRNKVRSTPAAAGIEPASHHGERSAVRGYQ